MLPQAHGFAFWAAPSTLAHEVERIHSPPPPFALASHLSPSPSTPQKALVPQTHSFRFGVIPSRYSHCSKLLEHRHLKFPSPHVLEESAFELKTTSI